MRVNLDALAAALERARPPAEIVLRVRTGDYVAWGDTLAEVCAGASADEEAQGDATRAALRLDRSRDLDRDPAFGIEQLETIAWSSISTSKQNPAPGLLVIRNLRDLLARWSGPGEDAAAEVVPVVYDDQLMPRLLNAFVTLGAAAAESTQPQTFAEVLRTLGQMAGRVTSPYHGAIGDGVRRLLPAFERFVVTPELERAARFLADALAQADDPATAAAAVRATLAARLAEARAYAVARGACAARPERASSVAAEAGASGQGGAG